MTAPTVKTHEVDEPASLGEFCGMCVTPFVSSHSDPDEPKSCQRQVSRYTCPSCNLFYCSLNCFRSEVRVPAHISLTPDESPKKLHSRCSEMFYRKEIEIGIKSGSSKSEEDRNKMLELLKRVEHESAADEVGLFHPDEENEEDSLAHRVSAIDICESSSQASLQMTNCSLASASADDLLRLLNKKEKEKFFAALKDPSSELVQVLLRSTELEKTRQLPWWEAPSDDGQSPLSPHISYGVKPELMAVPVDLINQASRGTSLLYNICVVL